MEFLVGIEKTDKMLLLQFIVFRILELTLYCSSSTLEDITMMISPTSFLTLRR